MRILQLIGSLLLLALSSCSQVPTGATSNLQHPSKGMAVAAAPVDLLSALSSRVVQLYVGNEIGDVTAEQAHSLAEHVQILDPNGELLNLAISSIRLPEYGSNDPVTVRLDVSVPQPVKGWYRLQIEIDPSAIQTTVEDRLVTQGDKTFISNRFSYFPQPSIRRVVLCADGKVRVEFSEPVQAPLGQTLPSVLSGEEILDCSGRLDEIGGSVWLTCPGLRDSAVVSLPAGAMVGRANGQPVLDVDGQPFERSMNFADLRSDGQCYYFVP